MQTIPLLLASLICLLLSLSAPVLKAPHIDADFPLDANLSKPIWQRAPLVRLEYTLRDASPRPEISTTVRALWSNTHLYLAYECPYTTLTVFDPPSPTKRLGLWDRDVVEAFIGADPDNIRHYSEYEVAPTNERLDVLINLPDKDFNWTSRFESAVHINPDRKIWTAELRIPLAALSSTAPTPGARWRLNLFRSDRAHNAFLAWNPTLTGSTHTPERFGILEFTK